MKKILDNKLVIKVLDNENNLVYKEAEGYLIDEPMKVYNAIRETNTETIIDIIKSSILIIMNNKEFKSTQVS